MQIRYDTKCKDRESRNEPTATQMAFNTFPAPPPKTVRNNMGYIIFIIIKNINVIRHFIVLHTLYNSNDNMMKYVNKQTEKQNKASNSPKVNP